MSRSQQGTHSPEGHVAEVDLVWRDDDIPDAGQNSKTSSVTGMDGFKSFLEEAGRIMHSTIGIKDASGCTAGDADQQESRSRSYADSGRPSAQKDRPTSAEGRSEAARMPQRATPSRVPRDKDSRDRPETASQWQVCP